MATFNKFHCFTEHLCEGVHNLELNFIMVALTNTLPTADMTQLSQIQQIGYPGLSTRRITITSSGQTNGVYKLIAADLTLTSTSAPVGPFRYIVVYNDSPISPMKPLIGWYDYGTSITMVAGQTLLLDFNQASGLITL